MPKKFFDMNPQQFAGPGDLGGPPDEEELPEHYIEEAAFRLVLDPEQFYDSILALMEKDDDANGLIGSLSEAISAVISRRKQLTRFPNEARIDNLRNAVDELEAAIISIGLETLPDDKILSEVDTILAEEAEL